MKIVYIVKTELHYYPPCVSQIRMIKRLGIDIEVLYGTSNNSALDLLKSEEIKCSKVGNLSDKNDTKLKKIISWLSFRKALNRKMKKYDKNETVFWFGTAESIMPMKFLMKNRRYIITLLELLDGRKLKLKLLKGLAKNAEILTVCEETRGYIMKYWWNLKELPFVFPNKPFDQITERRFTPTVDETRKIIDIIKNDDVILYQGIIQNSEELIEIAKALNESKKKYKFVLMGIDKYNSVEKIRHYYDNVEYFSYVPAPYHLEVTSYAKIGIAFYRNDCLNKAFCAPNKIYEYTGFGIPIICNEIPGLKNTVGAARAAICLEMKKENIINAIEKIEENYDDYSQNAKNFFATTDNLETMKKVIAKLR